MSVLLGKADVFRTESLCGAVPTIVGVSVSSCPASGLILIFGAVRGER